MDAHWVNTNMSQFEERTWKDSVRNVISASEFFYCLNKKDPWELSTVPDHIHRHPHYRSRRQSNISLWSRPLIHWDECDKSSLSESGRAHHKLSLRPNSGHFSSGEKRRKDMKALRWDNRTRKEIMRVAAIKCSCILARNRGRNSENCLLRTFKNLNCLSN